MTEQDKDQNAPPSTPDPVRRSLILGAGLAAGMAAAAPAAAQEDTSRDDLAALKGLDALDTPTVVARPRWRRSRG